MTYFTSFIHTKTPVTPPTTTGKTPVTPPKTTDKAPDHVIQMRVVNRPPKVYKVPARAFGPPLFIFSVITLVGLAALGLLVTLLPNMTITTVTRYQGFCTIPIKDLPEDASYYDQPSYKVMPLRWSSDPDVQVFSTANEDATDDVVNGLREQFDIGDTVEKISVMDNGRHVNFIHDFEANVSGIVDTDRCFAMELDPELVMSPEVLVLSIEGGANFDISRVRSSLRALLPPAAARHLAAALRRACPHKPVYTLAKDEGPVIRKRSVDAPAHDYIYFAGRGVHEIEISNLAELLQHEQDNKLA